MPCSEHLKQHTPPHMLRHQSGRVRRVQHPQPHQYIIEMPHRLPQKENKSHQLLPCKREAMQHDGWQAAAAQQLKMVRHRECRRVRQQSRSLANQALQGRHMNAMRQRKRRSGRFMTQYGMPLRRVNAQISSMAALQPPSLWHIQVLVTASTGRSSRGAERRGLVSMLTRCLRLALPAEGQQKLLCNRSVYPLTRIQTLQVGVHRATHLRRAQMALQQVTVILPTIDSTQDRTRCTLVLAQQGPGRLGMRSNARQLLSHNHHCRTRRPSLHRTGCGYCCRHWTPRKMHGSTARPVDYLAVGRVWLGACAPSQADSRGQGRARSRECTEDLLVLLLAQKLWRQPVRLADCHKSRGYPNHCYRSLRGKPLV